VFWYGENWKQRNSDGKGKGKGRKGWDFVFAKTIKK
jgi:hypothetical protein